MAPLPDFANTALFPSFFDLPEEENSNTTTTITTINPTEKAQYFLLAQVKNNMTITKPTLTLTDRTHATEFALVFDGLGRDDLDLARLGFKKGAVAVVPNAVRTTTTAAKQGFVRIPRGAAGNVRVVPGSLARVLEVARWEGKGEVCGGCGGGGGGGGGEDNEGGEGGGQGQVQNVVKGCTGCGMVGYCCKECQVKDWVDGGHKTDCKMFKALSNIFDY